jgi:hypothetical protein
MTRFVLMASGGSNEDSEAITTLIKSYDNATWWHWLENSWLIVDGSDTLNVKQLFEDLHRVAPGVHALVTRVDPETWYGFGPKRRGEDENMFRWLRKHWNSHADDEKAALPERSS